MKSVIAVLLAISPVFTAVAQLQVQQVSSNAGLQVSATAPMASMKQAFKPLEGRWVVRSVEIDGEPSPAQIGQEPGDIITLKLAADVFVLG